MTFEKWWEKTAVWDDGTWTHGEFATKDMARMAWNAGRRELIQRESDGGTEMTRKPVSQAWKTCSKVTEKVPE